MCVSKCLWIDGLVVESRGKHQIKSPTVLASRHAEIGMCWGTKHQRRPPDAMSVMYDLARMSAQHFMQRMIVQDERREVPLMISYLQA